MAEVWPKYVQPLLNMPRKPLIMRNNCNILKCGLRAGRPPVCRQLATKMGMAANVRVYVLTTHSIAAKSARSERAIELKTPRLRSSRLIMNEGIDTHNNTNRFRVLIAFPFLHDRSPNDIDGSHGSHLRGMGRVSSPQTGLEKRDTPFEAGENPDLVSVLLLRVDIDIAIYAVNQKLLNPCRKQHPERQGDPADEISTDQS
jgi:hypothetical protein